MRNLKTSVKKDGQEYVDEPVCARAKRPSRITASLMAAFGEREKTDIVLGYERVRIRWMKPDGKGGLVPRLRANTT